MASRLQPMKSRILTTAQDNTQPEQPKEPGLARYERRKERGRENNISVRLFDKTADRELREALNTARRIILDSPHDYETISLITGLSVPTISKIALGKVKSPHLRTVQRIKAFGGYRMVDTLFRK